MNSESPPKAQENPSGFRRAFFMQLGEDANQFDSSVSAKFTECIDALEFRLIERKNYRNAVCLLARLGGNNLNSDTLVHCIEQFALHAILLGPLFFIDLKTQDPPRAALQAGSAFAERICSQIGLPTSEACGISQKGSSAMSVRLADILLEDMRRDEELCNATAGWLLMDLIEVLRPCETGSAETSPDRRFCESRLMQAAHNSTYDSKALVNHCSVEHGGQWCKYTQKKGGAVQDLINALATQLVYGPFEGTFPLKKNYCRTGSRDPLH